MSFSRLVELEKLDIGHNEFSELVSHATFVRTGILLIHIKLSFAITQANSFP